MSDYSNDVADAPPEQDFLTTLRQANVARQQFWHQSAGGCETCNHDPAQWSTLEWAGAMAGEAGEAANVAKKIKRLEGSLMHRPSEADIGPLILLLGLECADVIIYIDLILAKYGMTIADVVGYKFNQTSAEHSMPITLPAPDSVPYRIEGGFIPETSAA